MDFSRFADFDAHEDVRLFDLGQGAQAVIAVHSTYRGPAAGGTRVWRYDSPDDAIRDALRLSRGMSYKNAMADLPYGGGKSVIMAPDAPFSRRALFEAFGRAVESFGGRYIAAEDVGCSVADIEVAATQTRYVGGLTPAQGRAGGDPSPWTAMGVHGCIKAMFAHQGRALAGARVAVQGAGAVGGELCRLLAADGAHIVVADINAGRAAAIAREAGGEVAATDDIHRIKADVFAPCALGATLNPETLAELGADMVCGAANNQLSTPDIGDRLAAQGVLYCPDYVVNAGGIIAIHSESIDDSLAQVRAKVEAIPSRLLDIVAEARAEGRNPEQVADRIARAKIGRGDVALTRFA